MQHKPLPLTDWQSTKTALHCMLQIVGKIRMGLHPKRNHWWHVTLYVTATGLTTGPIPYQAGIFQMAFDFLSHKLIITDSNNYSEEIELTDISVADFYSQLVNLLRTMGIRVQIQATPFDPTRVQTDIPFADNQKHHYSNLNAATYFWQILAWTYPIFQQFAGEFSGKTTPAHLYWHSMDYVLTRFSGKKAPVIDGMDPVSAEAYSDEVISFGFWAGDSDLPEPAFYSYTYPAPDQLTQQSLDPTAARWVTINNSPMALLKYHDLIQSDQPEQALLAFLHSAYHAGATCAKWQID